MKSYTSLVCILLMFFIYKGQAQNNIAGQLLDEKGKPIHFATIALMTAADSLIVNGESTERDGSFAIKNIKDGKYILEASMLGYKTNWLGNIELPRDHGKQFEISLMDDAATLETVEVIGKVPLLEQRADRMIVNVENNITNLGGNLLDVMKKVPGVLVVGEKLQMAGQSNVTILIDGKTTQYMDVNSLLRDMPGDNIKKVEIIHQPGSEFEAQGTGPIINIILKKNSLYGTNGKVTLGVGKGNDWRNKASITLSHYQGAVNINGSIGYRTSPYFDQMDLVRNVAGDIYDQQSIDRNLRTGWRGNLGLDWDINSKHRVGFGTRYISSESDYTIVNLTNIDFLDEQQKDFNVRTANLTDNTWQLASINPYYRFEIDTSGHKIDLDFNLVRIMNDGLNILDPVERNGFTQFFDQKYIQPGETNIIATKIDYTYPFSKDEILKLGGRYSDAQLDNSLEVFDENNEGIFMENIYATNRFVFEEQIKAAYAKLDWQQGDWSGTAGIRYEESNSQGRSRFTDAVSEQAIDSILTRDIRKFFPSASISRKINKELTASLAYSYRIDRPRYTSLNSFVYYLDAYTFEKGNPNLIPALTHSTKFSLAYDGQPFFNVEYKTTNDAMVELTDQNDATGETNLSVYNIDKFENFNASLFFPLDFIPKVSGFGGVIANHGRYRDASYLEMELDRSKWDFTGFLQMELTLPAKIQAEITGWYNSGSQEAIVNTEWLYGVDVGLSRKFLDDKLQLNLSVENILARYLYADIQYANMDISLYNVWDGPVVNFQASYKFGNQHMKTKESRRGSAADEINRAQKN